MPYSYSFINVVRKGDEIQCSVQPVSEDSDKFCIVSADRWIMTRESRALRFCPDDVERVIHMAFQAGYAAAKEDIRKALLE